MQISKHTVLTTVNQRQEVLLNYRLSDKPRQKGNGADKSRKEKAETKQQRQTLAFFHSTATSCWSQSANLARLPSHRYAVYVCVCVHNS